MKIGIIVHSSTGNTYSVAEKLKDRLLAAGHTVELERVTPRCGEEAYRSGAAGAEPETVPDTGIYDALVFGAPVRGFSLSPVMSSCLEKVGSLTGKKIACFVTEGFPYPWMGGNNAVNRMKKLCESRGADICGTGVVNWMGRRREKTTTETVDKLTGLFV